jgi:hypothetical protein
MIITRSGLTVRCARCEREVRHFAAAYDPLKNAWVGTAFCHGDSTALVVPDATWEATVFRARGVPARDRASAAGKNTQRHCTVIDEPLGEPA